MKSVIAFHVLGGVIVAFVPFSLAHGLNPVVFIPFIIVSCIFYFMNEHTGKLQESSISSFSKQLSREEYLYYMNLEMEEKSNEQ